MIMNFLNWIDAYSTVINFICYIIIFLGGFYVAIHSRVLPKWATTCIWYIGLSSLLVAGTIIVEWTLGQQHPLSYFIMGHATEVIMNTNLALMVVMLFFHTIYHDIKHKTLRKSMQKDEERITF